MRAGWHISVRGPLPGLALALASAVAVGGCGGRHQDDASVPVNQETQNAYMKKVRESMEKAEKDARTPAKGSRK